MNKTTRFVTNGFGTALLLAGIAACGAEVDPVEETGETNAALINNGGGLNADGDACSITGGPNKDKTGTRSGNFCCTGAGGTGHCQDCTTPSDWCSATTRVRTPIRRGFSGTIGTISRTP